MPSTIITRTLKTLSFKTPSSQVKPQSSYVNGFVPVQVQPNFFQVSRLQSELISSILSHPCSFMIYYYLFGIFCLSKLLFSGFIQYKGNFVRSHTNSKPRDWVPWIGLTTSNIEICEWDPNVWRNSNERYRAPLMWYCLECCTRWSYLRSGWKFHVNKAIQERKKNLGKSLINGVLPVSIVRL